jgi:hypothetical protein
VDKVGEITCNRLISPAARHELRVIDLGFLKKKKKKRIKAVDLPSS